MEFKNIEIKKEEELENKIKEEMECSLDEVIVNKREEKKTLFNKKIEYSILKISDVRDLIKEELLKLSKLMNVPFNVEIREKNKMFYVVLDSDNKALLIGKQGRTLDALLTVLKQKLRNETQMFIKVNIDVGNYKESNNKKLEILAKKLAKEVLNTGIEIKMDSMNSYQRRIIHDALNKIKGITTESSGEEPNRCVVIKKED